MSIDWTYLLLDQLDGHWTRQLRPRLTGLTDAEYFWEPAPGSWNIRPREQADPALAVGTGAFTIDWAWPGPDVPPVTTIAWRLAHINVGVLAMRVAGHFDGPPADHDSYPYAGSADEALAQLDRHYADWVTGVRGLDEAGLAEPCGPTEAPYDDAPKAEIVLHISREIIHHGAEIALLRDLYRARRD